MLSCLRQVDTSAGTIKRDFALLATTLRADASVDGGTKAFFFSLFADRTTHECQLLKSLSHAKSIVWAERRVHPERWPKVLRRTIGKARSRKNVIFVGF